MRILVLDESHVFRWVVEHVSPPGTEVLGFTSFDEAWRALEQNPPDAAVVSITPAQVPWRDFQHLCASLEPPVPVLYESCLFTSAHEAGLDPVEGYADFLRKPARKSEIREALLRLLAAAEAVAPPHVAG